MTKKELKQQLSDLKKWADQAEQNLSKHEALPRNDNDEVSDARVWEAVAAWSRDSRLESFLNLVQKSPAAPAPLAPRFEPAGPDSEIELRNFLRQMCAAMVDAQSVLDARSAQYLAETAGKPHILPSIFRLPKLSAQMKFALEVVNGEAINLLFYKRDEKATSRNEQSIDFDVVSVPAPPDAAATLQSLGPRLDLLLDPFERRGVLDLVKASGLADLATLAEQAPSGLLILSLPAQKDRRDYLILGITELKEHSVGLWSLTAPLTGAPQITTIYPLNRKNADHEKEFRSIIAEVVQRQRDFFAG